jgi:hypothetical protein
MRVKRFTNTGSGGRYDNPIPTRFLAPIDCLKIPALLMSRPVGGLKLSSISAFKDSLNNLMSDVRLVEEFSFFHITEKAKLVPGVLLVVDC